MNFDQNDPGRTRAANANCDPISGAPGAHPIGTGVGAAVGGAAAGAAAGTVVGPVGTVIAAALGAIVGGLAGRGVAEAIDPTSKEAYWRDNFKGRMYVANPTSYDDYGPAYGYGVSSYARYPERSFEDVEADLLRDWDRARRASNFNGVKLERHA